MAALTAAAHALRPMLCAGIGRIKARDNPAVYGTDREYTLRCPEDPFYKRYSAEASRCGWAWRAAAHEGLRGGGRRGK